MAAEQQLERSVLERKERDELRAIAQAMSLGTSSRSKKADIIDQILRAAGVEVTSPLGSVDGLGAVTNGSAAHNGSGSNGSGSNGSGSNGSGSNGSTATAVITAGAPEKGAADADPAAANGTEPAVKVTRGRGRPKGSTNKASQVAAKALAEAAAEVSAAPGSASQSSAEIASLATADLFSSISTPEKTDSGAAATSDGASAPAASGTSSGADSSSNGTDNGSSGAGSSGTPTGTQQGSPARSGGPGQGNQGSGQSQQRPGPQQGGQNEPNNRRSRRRRGRERVPGPGGQGQGQGQGGDRELQGGSQEGSYQGELITVRGLLDLRDEGYGFVRADGYLPSSKDVYVSISQARRFALRKGDYIEGASRPAASNEKFPALLRIDSVSGQNPEEAKARPRFEDLTPLFPDSKLKLEMSGPGEVTSRIIDLLAPIGKGQRGLIVSPPKAGKTTVLKQIAHSIEANNPEVHLMVLLVDERPEEVTDMRRSVKGEVVASTFDRPSEEHTVIAELAIERAKRMVEQGKDVVVVLDGITRLARAYNLAQPTSGRVMSGGVDSGALYPPKKFFGAARNIEEGGSLTILATALVETGSKMDEVIFEEFKGTGNMELRLDRRLAERRLYPSIDVNASSTRHEELLFERGQLQQVWKLRRVLNALAAEGSGAPGLELLMDKIRTTKSNDEFLAEIAKGPA
jgi:transcription termination factor Rho